MRASAALRLRVTRALIVFATSSLWLPGCVWLRDVDEAPPAPIAAPDQFAGTSTGTARTDRWWETFEDPELNRLVQGVLDDNLQLRQAWARLEQADAMVTRAQAGWIPTLELGGSVNSSRRAFGPGTGFENTSVTLDAAAAYELDLWGKVAADVNAADMDLAATRGDVEALAMTLSANVAEAWFSISESRAQVTLIEGQIESNETYLELVRLRFQQGLATALDVYQQEQALVASRAQLPLATAKLEIFQNQLAVLLGKAPENRVAQPKPDLPRLAPLPALGLPAELVQRRPDVRAAQLRAVAADYRIAKAISDFFPSIRLSASGGWIGFLEGGDGLIYNLLAGLTAPIDIDGRRRAELERSKAFREDALAGFGQVVLNAFREVEDALVQEEQQRLHLVQVHAQAKVAESAFKEAGNRYLNGLSDYLPVLTALRTFQNSQLQEIAATRQLLSYRVQLLRALGGDWTRELENPFDDDDDDDDEEES